MLDHVHMIDSVFCLEEVIYISIWAFLGAILGFFSFSYVPKKKPIDNFKRCLKSIGVGLFIAFPLCLYLEESNTFSKTLNITIGGLGAFGLPDILLNWWPRLSEALASRVVSTVEDKSVDLSTRASRQRKKSKSEDDEG